MQSHHKATYPFTPHHMAKVEIYTKSNCPYCTAAKALLDDKGVAYEEIHAEFDEALKAQMLERSGGRRTFPEIFINGQHVGGFDDMKALDEDGRLDEMLKS